ncbi:MAG TPA: ATP-binding cassette domain-containing protein, partial [Terracidiphilus sp.]
MDDPELTPDSRPISDSGPLAGADSAEDDLPELAETMAEIAAAEPLEPLKDPEPIAVSPSDPLIVFDNVSISFDGRAVLENISFSVYRGQTLCILGRSGVGKSVSLRMLMGFLQPDSGSILVEGREIVGMSEA